MRENKKKCTFEKTGTRAVTNFQTTQKKIFFHGMLKKVLTSISIANAHKKDPFGLFF